MISSIKQRNIWEKTWKDMAMMGKFPETERYDITWHKILIDELEKEIDFSKVKKILECGCGNGIFGLEIANRYPLATLYLSDLSPAAIKYSKLLLKQSNKKRPKENFKKLKIRYSLEDMFELNHKKSSFDFVINGGSLEHYGDKEINLLINEMLRVVKPAGFLVIAVPNLRNFDLTLKRVKLFIKHYSRNIIFGNMLMYGGNDERDISHKKFLSIIGENINIQSIVYVKHTLAFPGFIPRSENRIYRFFENGLAHLGFNWANIFIIKKA